MRRRLFLTVAIALGLAPGTWWRTHVPATPPQFMQVTPVEHQSGWPAGWRLAGLWELESEGLNFGGFSALIAVTGSRLNAWSDRGWSLDLALPEGGRQAMQFAPQPVAAGWGRKLWDIESATADTSTGRYWLGFEFNHAIHRFSRDGTPEGVRDLSSEVDWPNNSGAEGMVRFEDGRFLVLPERDGRGHLFDSDPAEGAAFTTFAIDWPREDYAVTDAAALPDGRVLVLMRSLDWSVPPFSTFLAVGDPGDIGDDGTWRPEELLNLDAVLPRENFEGLAVILAPGDMIDIWLISDDNFSAFQRTLLVKLEWDGGALAKPAPPKRPPE